MSQHPSLRSTGKNKSHKSVLKRYEKIKELKDKEKWHDGDSVFGLPKLKIVKLRIKKEKTASKEEGATTTEGAVVSGVATDAKGAQVKETLKKEAVKKTEKKK